MTDIYFSFDTEDFTSNYAADAIRDEARILEQHGIRGNFNLVGYLARELVRNRRTDVLDALRAHTISFHSLRHTYHPTICEYTDLASYTEARDRLMQLECEGMGMVSAATGAEHFTAACPPGDSLSYVAMYAYADLGIPLYVGSLFRTPDGSGVYYCNAYHTNYDCAMEWLFFREDYDLDAVIEKLAAQKQVFIYNHPNMVLYREFWDAHNYRKVNKHPMHAWVEPPRRAQEEVNTYYARFTALIERLQADPRFRIRSTEELARDKMQPRTVTRDMLPAITEALRKKFTWLDAPVSLSVADCFYAAKHFMTSDAPYTPGFVHGFLEEPVGTDSEITLTAEEVRALADKCAPAQFLPPCFECGGKRVGPADLLFAMLAVAQGATTVTCTPRAQQCEYADRLPALAAIKLKGSWMHCDEFEDAYLTDRLRLQAWTVRTE